MKEMEIKNSKQLAMAVAEAEMLKEIMENVSHPNLMHIEKVFQVGSKFYMVFPLCTGGELYEHIVRRGHFAEIDAACLMRDVISGLHELHEHDILHLDIKPENILFSSKEPDAIIKLTDFGLAKLYSTLDGAKEEDRCKTDKEARRKSIQVLTHKYEEFFEHGLSDGRIDRLRGTIGYMSPELIVDAENHTSKASG